MAAVGALTACGGSTDSFEADGATSLGEGTPVTTLSTMSSSAAALAPLADANFTLKSAAAQARAPYTLGYAFQQGDVPRGSSVTADVGTLQVIPKNAWPDGSLKFAVLSGIIDLAANTPKTINLSRSTAPATGTPLDTLRLRFTNIIAEVGTDAFGSARWSGADWDTPFASWVSGPIMSSWIYRKPIGVDKHLVAWLEVRLFNNGMVEVLPWIENGYLQVAAPTNKLTRYTFTLGKTQRFSATIDLKHHQRTPLISGAALSYWLSGDATVVPTHNKAYLQATELVPSYMAKIAGTSAIVKGLVASYQPLQAGNFKFDQDNMASSGYQEPIGLLPQHDVLYLTSDAPEAYGAVVRNGFSAGRWGIHYRDETTNRPLRFSSYPTLNIGDNQAFKDNGGSTAGRYTPAPTGGNPPGWDVAHSPSVGYLAYLVTARFYFMEEVQFAATANYLGNGDNTSLRTGSKGLVQTAVSAWQTRSAAWDWRAKVQALAVTPDNDTALRSEFIASVEANIEHFHGRYVAQPNNPFGWIKPGESYDNTLRPGAPWQQDFVTAAFGYSVSLGLPISSAASSKLAAFFQWKAKSAVMRLGDKSGFWYVNAVPYQVMISPAALPDYDRGTGPWYTTDAQVYAATYANPPAWLGKSEGVLAAEYMPGVDAMWGNLMPAIAYAVRHGVPGAQEAYGRMVSASNWGTLRDAFGGRPVWSVQPAKMLPVEVPVAMPTPSGTPAWLAGAAVGQWVEIANTAGAGGAAMAYSGFAYRDDTNEIMIAAAGGHGDAFDNRVVSLRLTADAPAWTQRMAPSTAIAMDVPYYPDGKPTSRHLYSSVHFVPQVNRLMVFGIKGAYGNAHDFSTVDAFNPDTNTWDAPGSWQNMPSGHLGAVKVRATGDIWSSFLAKWSPVTKTWTQPITTRTDTVRAPIAHDSLRNQLFTMNWGDGQGYGTPKLFTSIVPCNGSVQISIRLNPSAALSSLEAEQPSYAGMDYDVANDRFLFYCGQGASAGRIYVVKPNAGTNWDISILPSSGKLPPATLGDGVHTRFRFIPALNGFVLLPNGHSNLFFIRTA
ncbi:hypothetical protein SAMN05216204_101233 [Massilia yuzhufengensis]|uniref:Uncharacterized protein n=2 Tax=Massilia yuzhufengensis TaxID=1164594 RepID=A0A1I1DIU3_9BURK|nr:hypothetical protein SAMN05216204_101233 [Massilia yuzhufengensis]